MKDKIEQDAEESVEAAMDALRKAQNEDEIDPYKIIKLEKELGDAESRLESLRKNLKR